MSDALSAPPSLADQWLSPAELLANEKLRFAVFLRSHEHPPAGFFLDARALLSKARSMLELAPWSSTQDLLIPLMAPAPIRSSLERAGQRGGSLSPGSFHCDLRDSRMTLSPWDALDPRFSRPETRQIRPQIPFIFIQGEGPSEGPLDPALDAWRELLALSGIESLPWFGSKALSQLSRGFLLEEVLHEAHLEADRAQEALDLSSAAKPGSERAKARL